MIVFEHICFEIIDILIAEGTAMMSIDCFFDTFMTVDMSTSRDIAIGDGIETDSTLKFML